MMKKFWIHLKILPLSIIAYFTFFLTCNTNAQILRDLIKGKSQYANDKLFDSLNFVLEYTEGRENFLSKEIQNKSFDEILKFKDRNQIINEKKYEIIGQFIGYSIEGQNLEDSCREYPYPEYFLPEHRIRSHRIFLNSMQSVGLELSTRSIVSYLKKLEKPGGEFKLFIKNLINSSCSKNISHISHESLEQRFYSYLRYGSGLYDGQFDYFNEEKKYLENIFIPPGAQIERGLNMSIRLFKSFCQWGNDPDYLGYLGVHLDNSSFVSYVIRKMLGQNLYYDSKLKKLRFSELGLGDSVHMVCDGLICRKREKGLFLQSFPGLLGSNNIKTDLEKIYCKDLKSLPLRVKIRDSYQAQSLKKMSLDERKLYQPFLMQIITGMPDIFHRIDNYKDGEKIFFSAIESSWDFWAKKALGNFQKDLPYEESLYIKKIKVSKIESNSRAPFRLDFIVGLGEYDKILNTKDKISVYFNLKVSKDLLRWLKNRSNNQTLKSALKDEFSNYYLKIQLTSQLDKLESKFAIKPWNRGIKGIILKEILTQLIEYNGNHFNTYNDEVMNIPVHFHYGIFALKYLNFKLNGLKKNQKEMLNFTLSEKKTVIISKR